MANLFLLFTLLLVGAILIPGCGEDPSETPREPVQAGRFYPAEPGALSHSLDQMLAQARVELAGTPRALIVPHAGYQFSGPVAAYAYKILQQPGSTPIKRVVLLATSHYAYFQGVVLGGHPYRTPLGIYPIDTQAIAALQKLAFPKVDNKIAATREHSDEVQIPFLQKVLPQARLVPIIVGELSGPDLEATAKAIATVIDQQTIIIVSSDFTHYGANFDYQPKFNCDTRTGIYGLDQGALDLIAEKSSTRFVAYLDQTGATICGRYPITLLLKMFEISRWPGEVRVLKYYTSGDLTGDWDHSVSYAAVALGVLPKQRR